MQKKKTINLTLFSTMLCSLNALTLSKIRGGEEINKMGDIDNNINPSYCWIPKSPPPPQPKLPC